MMISAQTHRLRTPSSRRSSFRIDYNVSERSFFLGDSASEFGIETRALSTKVKLAMAIGAHRGDFVWFVWAAVAEAVEMMDLKEKEPSDLLNGVFFLQFSQEPLLLCRA